MPGQVHGQIRIEYVVIVQPQDVRVKLACSLVLQFPGLAGQFIPCPVNDHSLGAAKGINLEPEPPAIGNDIGKTFSELELVIVTSARGHNNH